MIDCRAILDLSMGEREGHPAGVFAAVPLTRGHRPETPCHAQRRALQFDDTAGVPAIGRLRSYPRNLSGSCQRREPMDGQTSRIKPITAIIGGGGIGLSVGWR